MNDIGDISASDLLVLWAKTSRDPTAPKTYHPLICHMLDVGNVARALLQNEEATHLVSLLRKLLGTESSHVPELVPFLLALHDLGKASPSFQRKSVFVNPVWPTLMIGNGPPLPRP